jgi:hypothetical protein
MIQTFQDDGNMAWGRNRIPVHSAENKRPSLPGFSLFLNAGTSAVLRDFFRAVFVINPLQKKRNVLKCKIVDCHFTP